MKFAWKIFFVSFIVMITAFGAGGFFLINSSFTSSLNTKVQSACESNRYIVTYMCAVDKNAEAFGYDPQYADVIFYSFSQQISEKVKIGSLDEINDYGDSSFIKQLKTGCSGYRIVDGNGKKYIQTLSKLNLADTDYYIENLTDISDIYQSRDDFCRKYQIILLSVALFASLILVAFSLGLTSPLVKLSNISKQIAGGEFSKRSDLSGSKEIYMLSQNFNKMADYVEAYIKQLKKFAQSRDDFVADFTHELKTPLTSVIGYADMLRSYELDNTQRRQFADCIYNEGKRLEALSENLLNLIVLKNSEVEFQRISTEALFRNVGGSVLFLLKKYAAALDINYEASEIFAEPSLLKTLLYNLTDNACKALRAKKGIRLYGFVKNNRYIFKIVDRGCGIPKEELKKITQPFYMLDKSRARKMGGAGLGLALCKEIAKIHGSQLLIDSKLNLGTTVIFSVPLYKSGGGLLEQ